MKLRKFGNIGWDVSEISLGCWAMGADWGDVSEENAKNILKTSFDNGVNFFDTAELYPVPATAALYADTERIIGRWMDEKKNRDKIIWNES